MYYMVNPKMDMQIESLLENYRKLTGQDKIIPDERKNFERVKMDTIRYQLHNLYPGEVPQIESINPSDGNIIYFDSTGRKKINLELLGYQKLDDGSYLRSKTIFQKKQIF